MDRIRLYNNKTVSVENTCAFGGVEKYFTETRLGTVYVRRQDGLYEPYSKRQQMAIAGKVKNPGDPSQQQYQKQKTA